MCSFTPYPPHGALGLLAGASTANSAMAVALAEQKRKTGWETKFSQWRSPPSETENDKIDRTTRMIREAISANTFLSNLDLQIIIQGSYANNTNVRGESDVDVCVLMRDIYNYETLQASPGTTHYHQITHTPPHITSKQFKEALHTALNTKFGMQQVARGNKSLKIRSGSARVNADVVAANVYRLYLPDQYQPVNYLTTTLEGVAIHPDQGAMIINWPLQHKENGIEKNKITGGRYKAVVRVLKSLNLEMQSASYQPIPSFLLECLVYNCPEHCFANEKLYENVQSVLLQISFLQTLLGNAGDWFEVSGLKLLFGAHQKWQVADATRFATHAKQRLSGSA